MIDHAHADLVAFAERDLGPNPHTNDPLLVGRPSNCANERPFKAGDQFSAPLTCAACAIGFVASARLDPTAKIYSASLGHFTAAEFARVIATRWEDLDPRLAVMLHRHADDIELVVLAS